MRFIKRRAFTLVELLVVIAIIGLLSTVAVVATSSAGVNARNTRRKADMIQVSKALELYYNANNAYPSTSGNWYGHCSAYSGLPDIDPADFPSHFSWIPGLTAGGYMAKLPDDPRNGLANSTSVYAPCGSVGTHSCYVYRSDGVNYALLAYCAPEGTIPSSDPFYERHNVGEYKISSDPTATDGWY